MSDSRESSQFGPSKLQGRIHSLDCVRGLAALIVVLWHWQHMAFIGSAESKNLLDFPTIRLAFASRGWIAVDVFFTISGFIFFTYYARLIRSGHIDFIKFEWLRLSRLYPLYFLTLLTVIVGQLVFAHIENHAFIYPLPILTSVIINVLFIQGWGFSPDRYINGPSWSVSVEMLVYILFYAQCRMLRRHEFMVLLIGFTFGLAICTLNVFIGRGLAEFYMGGLTAYVIGRKIVSRHSHLILYLSAGLAMLGWALTIAEINTDILHRALLSVSRLLGAGNRIKLIDVILSLPVRFFVIPVSLFALVLHEHLGSRLYRRFSAIGDITYSSYLLHFPLSLALAIATAIGILDTEAVLSWTSISAYFLLLVALSIWAYKSIELPLQSYFRTRFSLSPTRNSAHQKHKVLADIP